MSMTLSIHEGALLGYGKSQRPSHDTSDEKEGRAHTILLGPFLAHALSVALILLVVLCHIGSQWIIRIGSRE